MASSARLSGQPSKGHRSGGGCDWYSGGTRSSFLPLARLSFVLPGRSGAAPAGPLAFPSDTSGLGATCPRVLGVQGTLPSRDGWRLCDPLVERAVATIRKDTLREVSLAPLAGGHGPLVGRISILIKVASETALGCAPDELTK